MIVTSGATKRGFFATVPPLDEHFLSLHLALYPCLLLIDDVSLIHPPPPLHGVSPSLARWLLFFVSLFHPMLLLYDVFTPCAFPFLSYYVGVATFFMSGSAGRWMVGRSQELEYDVEYEEDY